MRAWQPTPVFLPGESHGQRSLVGYSPWGCKESDMTEQVIVSHKKVDNTQCCSQRSELVDGCSFIRRCVLKLLVVVFKVWGDSISYEVEREKNLAFCLFSCCHVRLFATPWTVAHQASLSFAVSRSLLKLMSIESVMPSTYLILC